MKFFNSLLFCLGLFSSPCAFTVSLDLAVPRILSSFTQAAFAFLTEKAPKGAEMLGNLSLLNIYSPGTTDLEVNWWVRSGQVKGISSAHLLFLSWLLSVLWADHSLW